MNDNSKLTNEDKCTPTGQLSSNARERTQKNIAKIDKSEQALEATDQLGIPAGQDIGYTSHLFVQALFPYRKTDADKRVVHQGPNSITVISANGLPYGKYSRLIMAYIMTQTVKNATLAELGLLTDDAARKIHLGSSMNAFLDRIGIKVRGNGGKRGNLTLMRQQIERISSSMITVQRRTQKQSSGRNAPIIDSWDLWFDPANPDQVSLEESYIEITKSFYDKIKAAPIPIDLDVYKNLSQPRAMDLYVWLTLKKFWLSNRTETQWLFSWDDMAENFSTKELNTSVDRRNFRNEIKKAIATVTTFWPDAGITADLTGVTIQRGQPSVTIKPKKELG